MIMQIFQMNRYSNLVPAFAVSLRLGVGMLAAVLVPTQFAAADTEQSPEQAVAKALTRHCAACHGEAKQEAGLRLDRLTAGQWRDYDLLDVVVSRIDDGEMPPEDADQQLPDPLRRRMVADLAARLRTLEDARLPGTLNRLTRSEWRHTVEDILGLPLEKAYELPIDSSHAMGRLGSHQLLTPMAMRQYQQVIARHVNEAILDEIPEARSYTVDFSIAENQIGNTSNESMPWGILSHNDSTKVVIINPVKTFAAEGVYEFNFDYYFTSSENAAAARKSEQPPDPIEVDSREHFGRFGPSGEILNKVHTHDRDGKKLHPNGKTPFYRYDEPLRVRLTKDFKTVIFRVSGNGKSPRWVFRSVAVRGPLDKTEPPTHQRIFGNTPREGDLNTCKKVLDSLAMRLFRRPVDNEIMAPYYDIAAAEYEAGGNLYSATKNALKPMLCSPYMLFKDTSAGPELEGRMIATRLAYFLQNTAPDERLMRLAAERELSDPAVRRAEAERLLADHEKSGRFVRLFTHQWLGLEKFEDFVPNAAYIRASDLAELRPSLEAEPHAFFAELLRSNLTARNFIDSEFVVWDKVLFGHYNDRKLTGLHPRDVEFDEEAFRRVDLSAAPEEVRARFGGLVSMPVIMCMTTDGETTQPILRGAWVVQHLFGAELTPPDTVPSLEIDLSNVDKPKEILKLHKQDASCYSCHVKMDYMGLALENFDVMGRWQSRYLFPVIEGNKSELITKDPVDSLAESPDGQPVDGVSGLKAHLSEREDEIMRNLIETLFAYAIGREPQYRDRPAIDKLMKSAKSNDYKLRDMILSIVASESFTNPELFTWREKINETIA